MNRSAVSLLIIFSLLFVSTPVFAKTPLRKLRGKIVVSTKRFPSRFKSDKAMYKYMRKTNTHELSADGDKDWEFEYMAFVGKPLATLQASVTFYDITTGNQSLVDTFSFYTSDKTEEILNGHQRLSREKFKPNRKYLMVLSRGYGQKALARTKLVLR